ncbi:Na+-driven multidrug efflux pump [Gillisia sp. Hel_I_86]|uniref:MATE family efflux transporter n=1 Tax=Gillisia sp. Hel_I_86 TaxID=1249981 RepID=UPI001199E848|nr:MATE family efflux transporter [Gillisia sp. Hel_I_86]TVZ27524.1 Na+-driven multidrug efflux pump [Gillisia sp. Hel_I_86]
MIKRNLIPLFTFFRKFLNKGQERSIKAKKNILTSLLIKGGSIVISLVLVPLTINYVNADRYGIWLTISSIVAWFSFFDIGLTQGLRNKFAEAKASGDDESAQVFVSTAYAILTIVFLSVWILFLFINPFLDWSNMLNLANDYKSELSILVLIVFTYFCFQFVFKIITTIMTADQEPAKASLIDLVSQILSLIIIGLLVMTTSGSLIYLGLALCLSPLVTLIAANLLLFRTKYRPYRPTLSKVKFSHAKSLFNLGMMFFVIQIAAIVQFETANIIIARNFGPSQVTSYNIVYKYFNVLTMGFVIFLSPFWSASTEAYLKKDIEWIKNSMRKYNLLNIAFVFIGGVMLIFSNKIYDLWLGAGTVEISFPLSLWGFIYVSTIIFGSKYVSFLNGISALYIQFWASIFSPIIFIGLVFLFLNYFRMGVYALFIASVLANINGFIIAPLQYYMIIVKNKKGLWLK